MYLSTKPRLINSTSSFEFLAIIEEFIPDKEKAKAFVHKIEQTIDSKFENSNSFF